MAYNPPGGNPYAYNPQTFQQYGPPRPPVWPPQNVSGGYNPYGNIPPMNAYTGAPSMSYGQSLFRPQSTPENYSYTQPSTIPAFTPLQGYNYPAPAQPPAKRQRVESGLGGDSTIAWRNCSQPGCKFVGSGKDVEIHEEDRHLITRPGKQPQRSEEEERFLKRKGPAPFIEGTNIRLNTPEEIAQWIAERKARWPSAKRIAEKEAERKAAIERGEVPARGGKRGRGRGGMNSRANDPAAMAEDWGRTPVERVERDSETRGRGRGRGKSTRGGRGRGGHQNDQNRTQDGGWAQKTGDPVPTPIPLEKAAMEAKDTTLIGMNDYGSSEDHDDDSSSISSSSSDSSLDSSYSGESSGDSDSDDDGDGKETISPTPVEAVVHKPTKPVCKFFAKNGKCNRGNRCTFEHTAAIMGDKPAPPPTDRKKMPRMPPAKRANPFERPSMLGALLADPIQNTLSQLSQTIRFLVANDMLENVELRPGQAEEVEREKNKVVQVDDVPDVVSGDVPPLVEEETRDV